LLGVEFSLVVLKASDRTHPATSWAWVSDRPTG